MVKLATLHHQKWAAGPILLILTCAGALGLGCSTGSKDSRLDDWGVPRDLTPQRIDQLEELWLSGDVDQLNWIRQARSLVKLTLDGTGIEGLHQAPIPVRHLSIFNHDPLDVGGITGRLHSLTVVGSRITGGEEIKKGVRLVSIRLEGSSTSSLGLPPGLQELSLFRTGVDPMDLKYPASLLELSLHGSDVNFLDNLPQNLASLSLDETRVRHLRNLPDSLLTMELRGNSSLDLSSLPERLAILRLDHQGHVEAESLPPHLQGLHLINTVVRTPPLDEGNERAEAGGTARGALSWLPKTLEELTVRTYLDLTYLHSSLPHLRSLDIDGRSVAGLDRFPADLHRLTYYAPPRCLQVPSRLEHLELSAIQGRMSTLTIGDCDDPPPPEPEQLDAVRRIGFELSRLSREDVEAVLQRMPNLRELSLAQSQLDEMPDLTALDQLIHVDMSGSSALDLADRIPDSIEELLLADSRVRSLPSLPLLRVLDISNTSITDLAPLAGAPALEELTLHLGQIQELGDGFQELRILRLVPPK